MAESSDHPTRDARKGVLGSLLRLVGRPKPSDLVRSADALLSERGEASGVALAREVLDAYEVLPEAVRVDFLRALVERFGADRARLERAIARYREEATPANGVALHAAAEPRRQELIRRLNLAEGGTGHLVRMREDVMRYLPSHPELAPLDADFLHLLASWFNRGFLVLRAIDWNTPALILEKIIRYEAVHEIASWDDLRRRIDPGDRRCFAFFHPALPGEPLIFVEVALTEDMPGAIAPLLAPARTAIDARRATTAVFYSISNCQDGLRGVPLGNFLIKQVVEELRRGMPTLKRFVTLSPVPGFGAWLGRESRTAGWLSDDERVALQELRKAGWHEDPQAVRALRAPMTAALARYLVGARTGAGKVIDPVARFHLNNGARLERINWLGDMSARGLAQGGGFMVNYLYDPAQIEKNHEAFSREAHVVAARSVHRLVREDPARG
jgi:malonyl-CoA decarboxylase